jgi:hypothetical protein
MLAVGPCLGVEEPYVQDSAAQQRIPLSLGRERGQEAHMSRSVTITRARAAGPQLKSRSPEHEVPGLLRRKHLLVIVFETPFRTPFDDGSVTIELDWKPHVARNGRIDFQIVAEKASLIFREGLP